MKELKIAPASNRIRSVANQKMEYVKFIESRPLIPIQPRPYLHKQSSEQKEVQGKPSGEMTKSPRSRKVQKPTSPKSPTSKTASVRSALREVQGYEQRAWKMELRNRLIARMARLHKLPNGIMMTPALPMIKSPVVQPPQINQYWNLPERGLSMAYSGEERSAGGKMLSPACNVEMEFPFLEASPFINGECLEAMLEGMRSPMLPPPPPPLCATDLDSLLNYYCENSILSPLSPAGAFLF